MSCIMSCDLHCASSSLSYTRVLSCAQARFPLRKLSTHWQQNKRLNWLSSSAAAVCHVYHLSWDDELQHWNCDLRPHCVLCLQLDFDASFQVSRRDLSWAFVWRFPFPRPLGGVILFTRSKQCVWWVHNLNNSIYLFCLASSTSLGVSNSHIEAFYERHIRSVRDGGKTSIELVDLNQTISIRTSISNYVWHNWVSPRHCMEPLLFLFFFGCAQAIDLNENVKFDNW